MGVIIFGYHNVCMIGINVLMEQNICISAVFTHREDKNEKIWFKSVSDYCVKKGIRYYFEEDYDDEGILKIVKKFNPTCIFSFYYRKIIPQSILDIPKFGAINLHGSLLPKYRGRCPVNWQLINGETKGGVTLHYMLKNPDSGDIIAQKEFPIKENDTPLDVYSKLEKFGRIILSENVDAIIKGKCCRTPQDNSIATYYGGRKPEDGVINWQWNTEKIYNLIRAVTKPYPGAFTIFKNKKLIIWTATKLHNSVTNTSLSKGTIQIFKGEYFVKTGDGLLKLERIEFNGTEFDLTVDKPDFIFNGSLFSQKTIK